MHPDFLQMTLHDNARELDRRAGRAFLTQKQAATPAPSEAVVLRLCCVHDDEALDGLAQLEGVPTPAGRFLVAEVDGIVVAAFPLGTGRALADPFRPTAHLLPLLELRARQLAPEEPRGRGIHFRSALRSA
ncbi:MAG TPA: hypothetical protein VH063_11130 [Gaiellaceae bacterium]|jgi:hypothetical protein|nr:hypothetical protein [Gaiellaceae bacterium]